MNGIIDEIKSDIRQLNTTVASELKAQRLRSQKGNEITFGEKWSIFSVNTS